jgi:hypothetical protein
LAIHLNNVDDLTTFGGEKNIRKETGFASCNVKDVILRLEALRGVKPQFRRIGTRRASKGRIAI